MTPCDHCRNLLLDHLYGLLDPAEAAAVEAHLTTCPDCVAARAEAVRAHELFARAAKSSFPHVRFVLPVEPATVVKPAALRRTAWVPWAVAAGVLAMVPGVMLPLAARSARYETAKYEAAVAATRLADATAAYERVRSEAARAGDASAAAKRKTDAVLSEWLAAERGATANPVAVEVTKPATLQPGAPNELAVTVRDPRGTLGASRVVAEVRDQAGAVVHRQTLDTRRIGAPQPVRLPAGVWGKVTPQSELFLAVAAVDERTGVRSDVLEPSRLFGPVFATMLATDKAAYRPGERLYFRSLTLDRVTFHPPAREQRLLYSLRKADGTPVPGLSVGGTTDLVRVTDGAVEPVAGPDGQPVRGVGCGAFTLPADLADGEYTLTLVEVPGPSGSPPAITEPVTRTVKVRAGKPERFAKTIGFTAAAFAPGTSATAWAEAKFQGKPLAGATVTAVVTADGESPVARVKPLTTGADGRVAVTFGLPPDLPRGDVKLMVTFRTPDAEESVAERVPVAGKDVNVEFFPEGGKLVAGVPNRVYVRATTPAGRPVDVRGDVVAGGATVARVESPADAAAPGVNRGLGSFTFTPKAGTPYRFTLRFAGANPAGFDLPRVEADGVVMTVPDAVTAPGQPVRVRLHTVGRARKLLVGAYTRGRLADTRRVTAEPGTMTEVHLLTTTDPRGGVTRVTVFEEPADAAADLIPVAERLVFRKPGEVLNLAVKPGATADGQAADLSVAATDEAGRPVPAVLWAAVVNTAAAPGANDRSLPTHFLLAGEVRTPDELEHADFLLTGHPRAAAALDHVLATQGWRRFAEQAGSLARRTPAAERFLAMNGARPVATDPALAREHRRVHDQFWPRFEAAARAQTAALRAQATDDVARERYAEYDATRREAVERSEAARATAEPLASFRLWAGVIAGVVACVAAGFGAVALHRAGRVRGALPLFVAAAGAGGLTAYLAAGTIAPPAVIAVGDELPAPPAPPPAPPSAVTPGELVDPAGGQMLAKGANPVEPGVASSIQSHNPPVPNPTPPNGGVTVARRHIPDDLLDPQIAKRVPLRRPISDDAVARLRDADRRLTEEAASFAARQSLAAVVPPDAAFDRVRALVAPARPLVVREYAAPRAGVADEAEAADTILWQPVIVLPSDGKTTLALPPGTAPGGYQVLVAGHTPDGRLGTVRPVLPVAPAVKDAPAPAK